MSTTRESRSASKINEELDRAIDALLSDRKVAYDAALARTVGSVTAGVLLCQFLYWQPRAQQEGGWFWKTQAEIYDETALSRKEQETARRVLREHRVLEEKRAGVPAKLFFRLNLTRLKQLLAAGQSARFGQTRMPETGRLECPDSADQTAPFGPTITETTTETTTENVVVVRDALEKFGVTTAVATKLAQTYPEAYILGKLDLVQWLVATNSPLVGRNPAGYLRRAIEEDYSAPPTYKSPAERTAEAEARAQADRAEQERRREAEAEYARAKVLDQQRLAEQYPPQPIPGSTQTTQDVWDQTLDQLHGQVTRLNYELWLKPAMLIACDGERAVIAAPSRYHVEHLTTRLNGPVSHTLSAVLGVPVQCEYVPFTEVLTAADEVGEQNPPAATPSGQHDIEPPSAHRGEMPRGAARS